ncbi:MAG TPA: putative Ig domain-containing protein, partial [Bryobacteraceae bacterium]|nr:putative Ig domain-containing protein [Bryobacteraceae bacterium]
TGTPQSATLTIQPAPSGPATLAAVSCNPGTVLPGGSSTCTVSLTKGAPAHGITVALSSSNPQVSLPGAILIPAGGTSATVTATAAIGAGGGIATILASATSVVQSTVLTIAAAGGKAGMVCAPAVVQTPGTANCTLSLQSPAPFNTLVLLSSSSPSLTVPPSITIGAGLTSATFTATATAVSASTTALVSAPSQSASQSLTLLIAVKTDVTVTSVSCSPTTLTGGGAGACQIGLSGAVPGGVSIQLSSSSTQVTVPAFVQPPAGSTSAPFIATSTLIDHDEKAQFIANLGSSSAQTNLSLIGVKPVGLACAPTTLQSGSPLNCRVTLNSGQAATPIALALASSDPHVKVPVTVSSQAGQASIGFQASTTVVRANQTITLSAGFKSSAVQSTVTLTPQAPVLTVPGLQVVLPGKAVTFTVSASDPAGLSVALSIAGLPPNAGFNPNSGTFSWYPQATQTGLYIVHFTGTNLAGVSTTQGVVIEVTSSTPVISMLANAASFTDDGCSPGAVATLLGTGFVKAGAKSAQSGPLPTELNGLRVKVNDAYMPVLYAGENAVNFQCPQLAAGSPVSLTVESDTGTSSTFSSQMNFAAPGIFTLDGSGKGQGAILIANTNKLAMTPVSGIPGQLATPGGWVSIYATGLGPTDVKISTGAPAPLNPLAKVTAPLDVLVDGQKAEVNFAGLAPGYNGLYVVNAQVPAATLAGSAVPVQIAVHLPDGTVALSNSVTIAVSPAGN